MKGFLCFVVGILVGAGLHWYFGQPREQPRTIEARATSDLSPGETNTASVRTSFDKERIQEELARTGRVIREKTRQAGAAIADATADARITGAIKGRLLKESNLAALKIDVDTHEGAVTLSGVVASAEHISRAMEIAYETEGVRKVVSTLQVKGN